VAGNHPRLVASLALLAWFVPGETASLSSNLARLHEMPIEHRRHLEENLARYDSLDSAEQKAIRELDAKLESLPEEERLRYLAQMRRYANWVATLPTEEQNRLSSADAAARLELVQELRTKRDPGRVPPEAEGLIWIRSGVYNPIPMFEAAYLLKVWYSLDDKQRADVERLATAREQQSRVAELGRSGGIAIDSLMTEVQALIDEVRQRPAQRPILKLLEQFSLQDLFEGRPGAGRPSGLAVKKMREEGDRVRANALRTLETLFFQHTRNQLKPIPGPQLSEFERRLPEWYRQSLDLLPPEPARDRLIRLRRFLEQDQDLIRLIDAAKLETPRTASPRPKSAPSKNIQPAQPGPGQTPF
jgi:Protein of unknown function (DUF3106)